MSRKLHQAKPAISFAPYAYLLNSSIRQATGVQLKGAIVVFDEVTAARSVLDASLCRPHITLIIIESNIFSLCFAGT